MELEKIVLLETTLDHLTGEELGHALDALTSDPIILDAIYLPAIGKKNRPAGLLQVMATPENEIAARDAVFRHTHTLGMRRQIVERYVLPRYKDRCEFAGEEIAVKKYELEQKVYMRPEADEIKKLARKKNGGSPALRFACPEDAGKKAPQ